MLARLLLLMQEMLPILYAGLFLLLNAERLPPPSRGLMTLRASYLE